MAEGVCTHPNCERHGKSPVVGIGCDGNEAVRATSGPLTASGGQSGVRVTPRGPEEAYSGAEGVGEVIVSRAALEALIGQALEDADGMDGEYGHRPPRSRPEVERLVAALDPGPCAAGRRTARLAGVLKEVWMAGEQLNMARPVGERIDWEMFARAIERRLLLLATPVDTGADQVERGARAMFAVTNRSDDWDEPSIPEHLKEHYRTLARAVLEAR